MEALDELHTCLGTFTCLYNIFILTSTAWQQGLLFDLLSPRDCLQLSQLCSSIHSANKSNIERKYKFRYTFQLLMKMYLIVHHRIPYGMTMTLCVLKMWLSTPPLSPQRLNKCDLDCIQWEMLLWFPFLSFLPSSTVSLTVQHFNEAVETLPSNLTQLITEITFNFPLTIFLPSSHTLQLETISTEQCTSFLLHSFTLLLVIFSTSQ